MKPINEMTYQELAEAALMAVRGEGSHGKD